MGLSCSLNKPLIVFAGILVLALVAMLAGRESLTGSMITGHLSLEGVHEGPEFCGNGILDLGEDHTTCCLDAGCQRDYVCTEFMIHDRPQFLCAKMCDDDSLEETFG